MATHPPTHSVTSQSPGHNLTVWYRDISPHLLMYRVEIKQLPAFLNRPPDCLPKCLRCMDKVPRQQHHACFLTHDTSLVMIGYLDLRKKRSLISEFKSTNDCRPEEGREGGQEGPLSLCLDEVKVRRGGDIHAQVEASYSVFC